MGDPAMFTVEFDLEGDGINLNDRQIQHDIEYHLYREMSVDLERIVWVPDAKITLCMRGALGDVFDTGEVSRGDREPSFARVIEALRTFRPRPTRVRLGDQWWDV